MRETPLDNSNVPLKNDDEIREMSWASVNTLPKNNDDIRMMFSGILKDYDAKLRPNYLGKPVEVTVDTTVLSISNIDEVCLLSMFHSF